MAEYEQLPPEAHADCMGPPKDDLTLLCACLHCGEEGHRFEAIEMRWMANERMWACPCTTCGGRGFGVDIHSAEDKWQCVECGHFYLPPDGDHRSSNAKCPKCGCTEANEWFDDEYDEDYEAYFDDIDELEDDGDSPRDPAQLEMDIPYTDEETESWGERGESAFDAEDEKLPDDIDYPRTLDEKEDFREGFNEDDIPF
jgi:predicted  nucleic acid-binding Zn-ribbon protein